VNELAVHLDWMQPLRHLGSYSGRDPLLGKQLLGWSLLTDMVRAGRYKAWLAAFLPCSVGGGCRCRPPPYRR
jgi:hypothetical protein